MLIFIVLTENGIGRLDSQVLRCDKVNQKYSTAFFTGRTFRFGDLFAVLQWFHLHGNCKMERPGFLTGLLQCMLKLIQDAYLT